MTEPARPVQIDEVILELQSERPILAKTKVGQVGNQKTRYADLVQVNEVVLKRLNELDTIWTCRPHFADGTFGLHYSLRHVPSNTEVAGVWPLKLSDNPQQLGSAVTYGRRYALLAVTGIVAEDDDDDGTAAGTEPKPRVTRTVKRQNGPELNAADEAKAEAKRKFDRLHILWRELGWDRNAALMWGDEQLNRGTPLASSTELTPDEVITLIGKAEEEKKKKAREGG